VHGGTGSDHHQHIFIAKKEYLQEPPHTPHRLHRSPLVNNLAVGVDSVGEQRVRVSVVKRLGSSQTGSSAESVAEIVSTRAVDGVGVGLLVEDGGGLVLGVAGLAQTGEVGEEDGAVGDVAGGGDGVGQDVGAAALVLVVAVGGGGGGGAGAVAGDGGQARGDLVLGRRGGRLEVGANLGAGAGGGGGRGGQLVAVGQRGADGGELGAGAAGLDRGALGQVDGLVDLGGQGAIDGDGELLGVVGEGARELGGVLLSVGDKTLGEDLEVTTIVERVESSSLNSDLLGLSSLEGNEVLSRQARGQEAELDALESNLLGYGMLVTEDMQLRELYLQPAAL
jgi:hypothetical protein